MKVLVTGGAGFIGSNLVDRLIDLGHNVVCIDNESAESNEQFYWNEKADNHKLDICEYNKIYGLFNEVDVVFHMASDARIQPAILDPKKSIDTNVLGTFNILEASRKNNVGRVVLSSTSSAYGKNNLLPNVETQKEDCLTPYSAAKVFGENLAKVYFNLYGLKTISLRYFNVYGERQPLKGKYAPVIGLFLKQYKEGNPLTIVGDGTQRRDFTYISDAISANMLVGFNDVDDSAFGQVYNVGYGKNYSMLDIASMICDKIDFIPARPGESKETLSNTDKIRSTFGWNPTKSLDEWIRDNGLNIH
jgi:UDP-glucose 4-epimerase